jgi:hypothetical protein
MKDGVHRIRGFIRVLSLMCIGFIAAEGAARVDDWWFQQIPFWAAPSNDDLFMVDSSGQRRGRPNAHYQKWQLNSFGFRGPQFAPQPPAGLRRVVLLGASETFGLYEAPQKEFAAQLAALTSTEDIEVVNAALPGITVGTLRQYWDHWVSRFGAKTVIIYPSTHLYVSCEDWRPETAAAESAPPRPAFRIDDLRLFGRARNIISQPDFMVRWRNARKVEQSVAQHPASWVYTAAPAACVTKLHQDLLSLIDAIQRTGAQVIVCTQALRAARDPTPADLRDLESFRVFSPRAPGRVIREFVTAADTDILKLPAVRNVSVVDVDAALGGHRSLFEDLVHYNDRGSQQVAALLHDRLVTATSTAGGQRP